MRGLFRLLGFVCVVLGIRLFIIDVIAWIHQGAIEFVPAQQTWLSRDPDSLFTLSNWLWEGSVPMLWDPILVTLLVLPAWVLLIAPGALLIWIGLPRMPEEIKPIHEH